MSTDFYIAEDDSPGKRAILTHGLRLFAERGLSATSIRDIAAEAGLSNPALYKHFKTKEALALVLFERSYREMLRRLRGAVGNQAGFQGKLRAFAKAFVLFYDAYPHALMFATDNLAVLWPQAAERLGTRTVITELRDILRQGRAEGHVSDDGEIDLQVALVTGLLGQLTRQLFLRAMDGPAEAYLDQIDRLLGSGLR